MQKTMNAPIIDGVTEKFDEVIRISELIFDEDNTKLYSVDDPEYFESLKESIKTHGLKNPIVVYPDNTLKAGHTRTKAATELGYTHIPIIRSVLTKPLNIFQNMMALQMENQTRPTNLRRQYNQVVTTIKAYELSENKVCAASIIEKQICPAAQLSYNMYKQLAALEVNRLDLFNRVMDSNGSKLSPGKAFELMQADLRKVKTINISKALQNAVTKEDVVYAVNAVSNAMHSLKTIKINARSGNTIPAFDNIQQNTIGGLVHEVFTNAIAHSINHRANNPDYVTAFPDKSHADEDIQFKMHNAGIEVKTCLIKDGNKMKFVCKNPKHGYFLFAGFTPDYDRCYVGFGLTDEGIWKKAGSSYASIDMEKLCNSNLDTFFGELKLDKDKVVVHTDKLTIL